MSRTLVGEEPKELPAQAMSLLVFREQPKLLTETVLSNNGNSFQLTSLPFQLDNDTHFLDSQVGVRTIKLHRIQLYYKYLAAIYVVERAVIPFSKSLEVWRLQGLSLWSCCTKLIDHGRYNGSVVVLGKFIKTYSLFRRSKLHCFS